MTCIVRLSAIGIEQLILFIIVSLKYKEYNTYF